MSYDNTYSTSLCPSCGKVEFRRQGTWWCPDGHYIIRWTCWSCYNFTTDNGFSGGHFGNSRPYCPKELSSNECSDCGGDGLVDSSISCSHGRYSTHNYCSHGRVGLHD